MFKFPNELLNPPSIWYKSLILYKGFIMKFWPWFFLYCLFVHGYWNINDIYQSLNLSTIISRNYTIYMLSNSVFLHLLIYPISLYLCFFSLLFIYSKTKAGESFRKKIHKTLFRVYWKLLGATILFYLCVGFSGATIIFIIFTALRSLAGNNYWLVVVQSSPLSFLFGLPAFIVVFTCINYLIFYCFEILFHNNSMGIMESFSMSYHLVKRNFWRNFIVLSVPVALICFTYYGTDLLCDYIRNISTNNFLQEMSILITRSIWDTVFIPLLMSVLLMQFSDLEMRRYVY